jgi:hypothetical protein
MPVYVDEIKDYTRIAKARRLRHTHWCHLVADTREELHVFAAQLGLRRSWFHGYRWHYDITPPKRARAVKLGAAEIDHHGVVDLMAERRAAAAGETGHALRLTRPGHPALRIAPYDKHHQADGIASGLRSQMDSTAHVPGTIITVVPYDARLPHTEPYVPTGPHAGRAQPVHGRRAGRPRPGGGRP